MTERSIAAHFCGQQQPHAAHEWHTAATYGAPTWISTYQCAGLLLHPPTQSTPTTLTHPSDTDESETTP